MFKAYLLFTWGALHHYFGNRNKLPDEHQRAVHYYTRAYDIYPMLRRARLARATILWRELDRADEAIRDLDALLIDHPRDRHALLNRALAHQQAGHYARSLADLDRYLELPRDDEYRDVALRMQRLLVEMLAERGQEPDP